MPVGSKVGIMAGRAFVGLYADDTELDKTLRGARLKLSTFSANMNRMGVRALAFGAGITTPLALAFRAAATFEKQMAQVAVRLEEPQKQMAGMSAGVRDLSVKFGRSTEDMAAGLSRLLGSLIAPDAALQVLDVASRMAALGFDSVDEAADTLVGTMNAYHLAAGDAAKVSDILWAATRRSGESFGPFATEIEKLAPLAAQLGMPLESLAAIMSSMGKTGMPMTTAFTGMRAIFSTFLKPTDEAHNFAKKLGIDLSADALQGDALFKSLKQVSELTPAQQFVLFPNIRGFTGIASVLGDTANLTKTLAAIQDSAGASMRGFGEVAGTAGFQLDKLKASVSNLAIEVGEALMPQLLPAVKAWSEWISANKELIASFAPLLLVVGITATAVGTLALVLGQLAAVAAATMASFGLILGISAVVAVLIGLGVAYGLSRMAAKSNVEQLKENATQADGLVSKYEDLVNTTNRTARQNYELQKTMNQLKAIFPELASQIDGTTGSLKAFHDELAGGKAGHLAAEMAGKADVRRLREQWAKETEQLAFMKKSQADFKAGVGGSTGYTDAQIGDQAEKLALTTAQWDEAYAKLIAERVALGEVEAVPPVAKPPPPTLAALAQRRAAGGVLTPDEQKELDAAEEVEKKRQEIVQSAQNDLNRANIEGMKDRIMAALAEANDQYREELRLAGDNEEAKALIKQTWIRRTRNIEEADAREQDAARLKDQESLNDEIDEAYIRSTKKGLDQELALVEDARRKAVREAKATATEQGQSPEQLKKTTDKIGELYDLKEQIARAGGAAAGAIKMSMGGTFGKEALWGMGSGDQMQRLLIVQEASKVYLQKISDKKAGVFG